MSREGPGKENYELMSEKMDRIYKGYKLNSKMQIEPLPDTPVINL